MMRVTCSRILKIPKPYFSLGTKSSSRCFDSRSPSQNLITRMITSSLRDVVTEPKWQPNPSFVRCRIVSSHAAQMPNYHHQSVSIETLDSLCGEAKVRDAVQVIDILEDKGIVVDLPRLLGLAKLCGDLEALEEARFVHDCIFDYYPSSHVRSSNVLIEMYSRCGSVDDALKVFDEMPERNTETWCVMMRCLTKNGEGEVAIDMFTRFKEEGNKPDKEIFKAVFSACASLGDINEGLLHFQAMYRDYGMIPSMEDYVSLTEMLAACGHLDEALEFVERMDVEPSVEVWETLMNLCWVHGDLELGDRLAKIVKELDATRVNKEGLVVAKATEKPKQNLKRQRREKTFKAGDTSHPESDRIIAALRSLKMHMLEMGFVPATWLLGIEGVDDEEREQQLLLRSQNLAFAYVILNSDARSKSQVSQNLRICVDGHNTLKMISLITGRQLVVRAIKRVHHFENGLCSCRDYW